MEKVKEALGLNDEKNSSEAKASLGGVDLLVYNGSILNCKADAIVCSVDNTLTFSSKLY